MKPTYIFFDRSYGYARSIVALLGGLTMVIWPDIIKKYIVLILGALILAVGIATIIIARTGKWKNEKVPLLNLNSIVDIAFGIILLVFPDFFASLLMFLFGLVLLIFGMGEIISLVNTGKLIKIPVWTYIGPTITAILGFVLFFYPDQSGNWLFIIFGISLLLYAATELASTFMIRKKMRDIYNENNDIIKDVDYEEVEK